MNDNDMEIFGLIHTLEGVVNELSFRTASKADGPLVRRYRNDIDGAYIQLGRILSRMRVREIA